MYVGIMASDAQADGRETGYRTTFHGDDYFFATFEIGFLPVWETSGGELPGGYRFGVWYDPQPKGRFVTGTTKRDDLGFYFGMDQLLYKELPDDDGDSQGLGMFFRYGFTHEEVNSPEHFWSIGLQYEGLIATRDADILGFGFAQGVASDDLLRVAGGGDRESVYELYYNIVLFPWLSITPDLQYIAQPGSGVRDAFVAGIRAQMSF